MLPQLSGINSSNRDKRSLAEHVYVMLPLDERISLLNGKKIPG